MEKIKEKMLEKQRNFTQNNKLPMVQHYIAVIDEELQDYTFIRVPKRVKLSKILEDLQEEFPNDKIKVKDINGFINIGIEHGVLLCSVFKNEVLVNQDAVASTRWLYEYWLAGTFIEVDV